MRINSKRKGLCQVGYGGRSRIDQCVCLSNPAASRGQQGTGMIFRRFLVVREKQMRFFAVTGGVRSVEQRILVATIVGEVGRPT